MKKLLLIFIILLIPITIAIPDLSIEKIDKGSVIIQELNNPAIFDFIITNKGAEENFEIFSLVGVSMAPKGFFNLAPGENKIEVFAYPGRELRISNSGFLTFEYQIHGQNSGLIKDTITIKIVPLKEILDLNALPLSLDDSTATIIIKNRENAIINNLNLIFVSEFFNEEQEISLNPFEEKNITLKTEIDKKLSSGPYIFTVKSKLEDHEKEFEGIINYLEKESTFTSQKSEGFIIRKTTVTKTNEGNTQKLVTLEQKKDILSRLFTINSPLPDSTERSSLSVTYTWTKTLKPSESISVTTTTNYTIPFILLILIIIIVMFLKMSSQRILTINKKVSFVKTKGGELALKVTLHLKAKKHVENVQINDILPRMTKLYEKYGKKPDHIDKASRQVSWNFDKLNSGEDRLISYIIYSKVAVIGRFELPQANAKYKLDGKPQYSFSNKTYFVAETSED